MVTLNLEARNILEISYLAKIDVKRSSDVTEILESGRSSLSCGRVESEFLGLGTYPLDPVASTSSS